MGLARTVVAGLITCVAASDTVDMVQRGVDPKVSDALVHDVVQTALARVHAGSNRSDVAREAAHAAADAITELDDVETDSRRLLAEQVSVAEKVIDDVMLNDNQSPNGESDLAELTLLAGAADDDIELNEDVLRNLGWQPRVHVTYNPTGEERSGFHHDIDHAQAYEKDGNCLAVFAATNDETDRGQGMAHLQHDAQEMCGYKMHAGAVSELAGFMAQGGQWQQFISFLTSSSCNTRTAVGHSLGGAVATAFATCANSGTPGFGHRSDFRLVTFAPFPIFQGESPFFNGTRYGVVDSRDWTSGAPTFTSSTKDFRVGILDFLLVPASAIPAMQGAAHALNGAKHQISSCAGSAERQCVEGIFAHVAPQLVPLLAPAFGILMNPAGVATQMGIDVNTVMTLAQQMQGYVVSSKMRGELEAAYDPVQVITNDWDYVHARVKFQPLRRNPAQQDAALQLTDASDAAEAPKYDIFESLFITLAAGGGFPNHAICCYSTADNCASKFTEGWKACDSN